MSRLRITIVMLSLLLGGSTSATAADREARASAVEREQLRARTEAVQRATRMGWPIDGQTPAGDTFRLVRVTATGAPVYESTLGAAAAISSNAIAVQQPPLDLGGRNVTIGIWDSGYARTTHQEFQTAEGSRIVRRDQAALSDHATGVAGAAAASGSDALCTGTAPLATVWSYNWGTDQAELITDAHDGTPGATGVSISNNSYGFLHGWEYASYSGTTGWHWMGAGYNGNGNGLREDPLFGQYSESARAWDQLLYDNPYVSTFWPSGNDRNDVYTGSTAGDATFYYIDYYTGLWVEETYLPENAPGNDNQDGGYDTMITRASAKNVIAVGATLPATADGERIPELGEVTGYSGWGPADDGRIKPDVVANGHGVHVPRSTGDTAYRYNSGTSFSAPTAAGVAALIVEEARNRVPGWEPRASTVKALLLHGATDMGRPGPDYEYGFGLVDAVASVAPLACLDHPTSAGMLAVVEGRLHADNTEDSFQLDWDGTEDLVVTMSWTDPPGAATPLGTLDDRTPTLVHDLDLRVVGPEGQVWMPFTLDPDNPTSAALAGDNTVDTVEQVRVPAGTASGTVTVRVSHKGNLARGEQWYSVAVTGQNPCDDPAPVAVETVTPASSPRGQIVDMTVTGGPYPLGTTIRLVDGAARSTAAEVEVTTRSLEEFRGLLDLSLVPTGIYDIDVTTPCGRTTTVRGGFDVQGLATVEDWYQLGW